ncbi:serine protease inhibitor dipetalogastin isoform X2 [Cryptotermes secundus]|uniref:serine protease inhibitor dipetalogastin isoform X2 n=1 Tax=Cryptotermes secundus TaxID=105785 RepID=UPI000CD7D002|nr:serine protease inhibitor dipetalogastin isoform X2 [Cryptotermes secundus]
MQARGVVGKKTQMNLITAMILNPVIVAAPVTAHWHTKGEYICLEAAKNTTYDPLCASNNQTFQNFMTFRCFVRYFDVHGLTVRRGACSTNPEPDHCVLSFVVWRQVCGADNVTYSSVWEMLCEAQRQNKRNSVQYDGPCRVQCLISLAYKPVCSSENLVYANMAALKCSTLRNPERNITVKKDGLCWNRDSSAIICKGSKYTRHNGNEDPVCASNGVTYASYSEVACLQIYNHDIRILHDGPCKYKDIVLPNDVNELCHLADNNAITMPVCGSNNLTYPNPFVLKCAKLRGVVSPDVKVRHEGSCEKDLMDEEIVEYEEDPCKEQKSVGPADNMTEKLLFCASDGRSYYSSKQYACAVKTNSDWFHYTIVRIGVPCDRSDSPCEKLQLLPEALAADPICGSDGVSYANPLALMCAMITDPKLRKHHKGACIPPKT